MKADGWIYMGLFVLTVGIPSITWIASRNGVKLRLERIYESRGGPNLAKKSEI
jgi:hypothetical protein